MFSSLVYQSVNAILNAEYWRDLEMWVRGSFKVIENGTIR